MAALKTFYRKIHNQPRRTRTITYRFEFRLQARFSLGLETDVYTSLMDLGFCFLKPAPDMTYRMILKPKGGGYKRCSGAI